MYSKCLKSECLKSGYLKFELLCVWFSETFDKKCVWKLNFFFRFGIQIPNTVNVRKPNVQISAFSDLVRLLNRSVFERCMKTKPFWSDFRRPVCFVFLSNRTNYSNRPKTGGPVFSVFKNVWSPISSVIDRRLDAFVRFSNVRFVPYIKPNFRFSAFFTSLDRFIYKIYTYITNEMKQTFDNWTFFRPVCQTGRPVFGHSL